MAFLDMDEEQVGRDAPGSLNGHRAGAPEVAVGTEAQDAPQGELLELHAEDPLKAVRRQVQLWEAQDAAVKLLKPYWDANRFWYRGYRGVRLRPISRELYNSVELWVAPGAFDQPTIMNRVPELCERLAAHMMQDSPVPDVEPVVDTDENRDIAEFAERLLIDVGSEAQRNDQATYRTAFHKSSIYASMFTYQYPDQQGGRLVPVKIEAHPGAPEGTPVEGAHLAPNGMPYEGPFVQRYVREDGTISESAAGAKTQFEAKICRELLSSLQVRPLPDTADGIANARGIMILSLTTVGQLKERFAERCATLTADDWQAMVKWKPEAARWIAPPHVRRSKAWQNPGTDEHGFPPNDAVVVQLGTYYVAHPAYPKGCYFLSAGKQVDLHVGDWMGRYEGPDGQEIEEALELPVSQMRQMVDIETGSFYGQGIVGQLGPISEVGGAIILGWLDHLDRFLHPIQWVPDGSPIQLEDLAARDGAPQYYDARRGQPNTEQVPAFLPDGIEFFGMSQEALSGIIGIYDSAMGNAPASDSGRKVALDINQSMVNLSQMRQALADFIERDWRVTMQLLRCFTPVSQRVRYVGEDGEYKERAWRGADLVGVGNVRIALGSFTQRSPEARQMMIDAYVQRGYIDAIEAERLAQSTVRATIAQDDNPFWLKINREIAQWRLGPPADWSQQVAQHQAALGQWQQVAMRAQAMGQQPPPQPPAPTGPFKPSPTDTLPAVAPRRQAMLARLMATKRFEAADPTWQQVVLDAFNTVSQSLQQMQQAQMAGPVDAKIKVDQARITAETQRDITKIGAEAQVDSAKDARQAAQAGVNALREAVATGAVPVGETEPSMG